MMGALDGLKVADFTRFVAGPFCSMQLADHGADVIKIESPIDRGDQLRSWGPFFGDQSYYFMTLNKNKRSIAINLKSKQGIDVIRKIIKSSDVLIENFRPGLMDKMGFSWEDVHRINQGLIYCSITAYGQTGPFRTKAGFDVSVQGDSGFMDITGFDTPTRVGIGLTDFIGAFYGLSGILSALISRAKTGEGQWVDAAMMDGMLALLTFQAGHYFATGNTPERTGNRHPQQTPYGTFKTKDGYVIIGAGSQRLWENLCHHVLNRPDLLEDPRFVTLLDRNENHIALTEIIEGLTIERSTKEWMSRLTKGDVPCGQVRTVKEALELEHTKAREMVIDMEDERKGRINILGIPTKLSETPGTIRRMPPLLGEHTIEVLQELGYGEKAIKDLEKNNIIKPNGIK